MRGDSVEEPAVVRYHHGAAGEILEAFFQGADSVHIHIVGGLVEEQHVTFVLESQGKMQSVALTSGKHSAEFLLVGTREIKARNP